MHVIVVHVDAMNSDIIFGIVMYNIDMLIALASVCWTRPLVDVIHIFAYIAKMIDFILYDLLVGCTHIIRKYVDFNNSALCWFHVLLADVYLSSDRSRWGPCWLNIGTLWIHISEFISLKFVTWILKQRSSVNAQICVDMKRFTQISCTFVFLQYVCVDVMWSWHAVDVWALKREDPNDLVRIHFRSPTSGGLSLSKYILTLQGHS